MGTVIFHCCPKAYKDPFGSQIWFNNKRQVAAPAYQNAINNVILRASLPPLPAGRKAREFGIQTASWPLPEDPVTKEEENKGKIDT